MGQGELLVVPVEFGTAVLALVEIAPVAELQRLQASLADQAAAVDEDPFRLEYRQQSDRRPDAGQRSTVLVARIDFLDFDLQAALVNIIGSLHAARRGGRCRGGSAQHEPREGL